jgi:hypothetical protein
MVCKLSTLHFKKSGLRIASAITTKTLAKQIRLEHELVFLFGIKTLQRSQSMGINEMLLQAEHIEQSVARLQAQAGKPEAQRAVAQSMNSQVAAALCKWLRECKA